MNKSLAGLIVACPATLLSLGLASAAQAYPDNPPTGRLSPPQVNSAAPTASKASPAADASTGLPAPVVRTRCSWGAAQALPSRAAFVVVTRRRQTS